MATLNDDGTVAQSAPQAEEEEVPAITDLRVHLEAANRHNGDPDMRRFLEHLAGMVADLHGGHHAHISEYLRHREEDARRRDESDADYRARLNEQRADYERQLAEIRASGNERPADPVANPYNADRANDRPAADTGLAPQPASVPNSAPANGPAQTQPAANTVQRGA